MNNKALEKLLKEQEGLKKFPFKVRIKNGNARWTMTIHANTALYARKMANEQLSAGDEIVWVR